MKLGLNSAILESLDFYQLIDFAAEVGYECVEVACWPQGESERRYAGVSHINVDTLDDLEVEKIKNYCMMKNVEISALAFYPNTLDPNLEARQANIDHLIKVITAANKLGVKIVTTFIGRVPDKDLDTNLAIMKEVWPTIVRHAEEQHVKIAIENCPMLFSKDEWPGGKNLFISPAIWRKVFEILPSKNIGINYDPSHFVWQQIDYIKPLYEFKDRIFHVHFKDIKLYKDKLDDVGVLAAPLEYMAPKLPGLGDVNWAQYVSALMDINFNGYACIEVEDKSFEDSHESILKSVKLSYKYLRQFVI